MDYHIAYFKCCPHWDDKHWHWPGFIPKDQGHIWQLKIIEHNAHVHIATYLCIEWLPYLLEKMWLCTILIIFVSDWLREKQNLVKNNAGGYICPLDCLVNLCTLVHHYEPYLHTRGGNYQQFWQKYAHFRT